VTAPAPTVEALDATLARLASGRGAIWIGHGCRHAAAELRAFAEAAHLPVIASPRAKGVFPESHPQFVGVRRRRPRLGDGDVHRRAPRHAAGARARGWAR
jgi:thiamine pyrophosphate-dependent acetolactate synthase large subunit-like protein